MNIHWDNIIIWRKRHVRDKQFMLLMALVIGVLTALAVLMYLMSLKKKA